MPPHMTLGWSTGGFPHSSVGKESACNAGDRGWIPGSGRPTEEGIGYPLQYTWSSLVAQKESAGKAGDPGLILELGGIPWRRERLSTPVFQPGKFHGLYIPWGHKESDTSERLSLSLYSKGNCIQSPGINHNGKGRKKETNFPRENYQGMSMQKATKPG